MGCPVSNKVVANLITSPTLVNRLSKDIDSIANFDKKISSLNPEKHKNRIAQLEMAKRWVEANIIYMWISKHISDVFIKSDILQKKEVNEIIDILKSALPKGYHKYIDMLPNVKLYKSLLKNKLDQTELSYVIAFDVSMYHKFDNFKNIEKWSTEYLSKNNLWVSDEWYSIYRKLIQDIIEWNKIDIKDVVKKISETTNADKIVKSSDDAYVLLNNSSTIKELEDNFLLSLNYMNQKNIDLFLEKFESFRFIWKNKDTIKWVWSNIDSPFFNTRNVANYWHYMSMKSRANIAWDFFDDVWYSLIKDEPTKFIEKVIDLMLWSKKEITIWGKKYWEADKKMLYRIVWPDIIEASYAKNWVSSLKFHELRTIAESTESVIIKSDDIVVKPDIKFDTPLHQEARKYKSADEFVNSKEKVYHWTNAKFDEFDISKIWSQTDEGIWGRWIYFSPNKEMAKIAPWGNWAKYIKEVVVDKSKLFDIAKYKDIQKLADDLDMWEWNFRMGSDGIIRPNQTQIRQLTTHIQDLWYDWVYVNRWWKWDELVIFDPKNIKTESQLKQIREEANIVVKPDVEREFVLWYAPFREWDISDVTKIDLDNQWIKYNNRVINSVKLAEDLWLKIIEDNKSIWIYWKTSNARELSKFSIVKWKEKDINLYAALLWATWPDVQHSVLLGNYIKASKGAGKEYRFKVLWDTNLIIDSLQNEWRVEWLTYLKNTNEIVIIDFDNSFSKQQIDFINYLYKNEQITKTIHRPIQSRLIESREYLWIFDEYLNSSWWKQGVRSIRNAITEAYSRVKKDIISRWGIESSLEANLEKQLDDVLIDTPDYWNSVFRFVIWDWLSEPISNHIIYTKWIDEIMEWPTGKIKKHTSFKIWEPKEIIDNQLWLESKISSLKKWEKISLTLPDKRYIKDIQSIPVPKWASVNIYYPQNPSNSFFIQDWDVYLGVWKKTAKDTISSQFRKFGIDLWWDSGMVYPKDIMEEMAKGYHEKITIQQVADMWWIADWSKIEPDTYYALLKSTAFLSEWKFVNIAVDYAEERIKILDESIYNLDFFKNEAVKLSKEWKVLDVSDISEVRNAYYNYKFANTLQNKEIALIEFLRLYNTEPWDLFLNLKKQSDLFTSINLELDINFDWFDDFVSLLSRDISEVSDEMIMNDKFLYNTFIKNKDSLEVASSQKSLYNFIRWIKNNIDETIGTTSKSTQKNVSDTILVPKEWNWIAIIENDIFDIVLPNWVYDEVSNLNRFKISDEIEFIIDTQRQIREWLLVWETIIDDSTTYGKVITLFKSDVNSLFKSYIDNIDIILNSKKDVNTNLRKLYQAFRKSLVDLEYKMDFSFGKALSANDSILWFHYSIREFQNNTNMAEYIEKLARQQQNITQTLDRALWNIWEWLQNKWLMPNGNIVKWQIIQDWAEYGYELALKNWENVSIDSLRLMNKQGIKWFIESQVNKFNEDVKNLWIVRKVYEAIPWMKDSNILEKWMLVDDYAFGSKVPMWMINSNPSVYAKSVAIPIEYNQSLLKNIFNRISDMYTPDGYKLWDEVLRMWYSVTENESAIMKIIDNEIDNTIWLIIKDNGKDFAAGMSKRELIKEYFDSFRDYSELIKLPQSVVKKIWEKFWDWTANIDLFFKKYIWDQPIEMLDKTVWDYSYRDDYIKKMNNAVDNAFEIAQNSFREWYNDVISWWFVDVIAKQVRDVFENDSPWGRWLVKLTDILKTEWKKAGNILYRISPRNLMFNTDLLKLEWKVSNLGKALYNKFDYELLYKSQDAFKIIKDSWLYWTKLDDWLSKNWETHNQIAWTLLHFFNRYREILGNSINKEYLSALNDIDNVFYMIWRWKDWLPLPKPNISELNKEVYALAKVAENNATLWVFHLRHSPETPLKNMNFKMFQDWTLVTEGGSTSVKWFEKDFNSFLNTNISAFDYKQVYKHLFWWRLISFWPIIENTLWFFKKYIWWVLKSSLVRFGIVLWLNLLTWFSTWFLPWLIRGKKLTSAMSTAERISIYNIIWDYWLLDEYATLSTWWLKALLKEANRMWWGSIANGLYRSFQYWSLSNTTDLVTSNFNNFMDLVLMGNYKVYSVYNAMRWLDWRKFNSAIAFENYLKWLDDATRNNVLNELRILSNRWFYSVIAATDSSMNKQLPWIRAKLTWFELNEILSWIQHNMSFLNGWWDGVLRNFYRSIFVTADIGRYLLKNKLKPEAFRNVEMFIRKTPEYAQLVTTMSADILLLARWIRQWATWDDLYEDWEWITVDDIFDAVNIYTTIWNAYWASFLWQTVWRATETTNYYRRVNEWDESRRSYMREWWTSMALVLSQRFFADLKYLKPRNKFLAEVAWWESIWKAFTNMVDEAWWWMARYLIWESLDPENIAFTFNRRQRIPDIMWVEISDDQKQAYNLRFGKILIESDLWNFWSTASMLLQSTLINTNIIRAKKKIKDEMKWGWFTSNYEFQKQIKQVEDLESFINWEVPKVEIQDAQYIKNDVFNIRMLEQSTMWDWLNNWVIKYWNPWTDDWISFIYDALWKETVQYFHSLLWWEAEVAAGIKMDKKETQAFILNYIKNFIENSDLWIVEDITKATVAQTNLSFLLRDESDKLKKSIEKDRFFVEQFKQNYEWMLQNNMLLMTDFVAKRHNRISDETVFDFYDDSWNIKREYYDRLAEQRRLREAIDNLDVDFIDWKFNPLTQSLKYNMYKIQNKDWTINETELTLVNMATDYIKNTGNYRPKWVTAEMLSSIVSYNLDWVLEVFRKDMKMSWWLTEWTAKLIDNIFYTESIMSDYIMDLQTWVDWANWWDWDTSKIWKLTADFEKISKAIDPIREEFKSAVRLKEFKPITFMPNSNEKSIFKPKKVESYSPQYSKSIYEDNISEEKPKDIKRRIKPSKDFKFKE